MFFGRAVFAGKIDNLKVQLDPVLLVKETFEILLGLDNAFTVA